MSAGRAHTDLWIRFPIPSDNDSLVDDVEFNNDADGAATGLRPLLEIRYRAP